MHFLLGRVLYLDKVGLCVISTAFLVGEGTAKARVTAAEVIFMGERVRLKAVGWLGSSGYQVIINEPARRASELAQRAKKPEKARSRKKTTVDSANTEK